MSRSGAGRLIKAAGAAACVLVAAAGLALLLGLGLLPRTGSYRTLTVLSGSMRPAIEPGSVVIVRRFDLAAVRVGDVVTFQAPVDGHPTVTHRVTEVVRGGDAPLVRTKGDANASPDSWVVELGPGAGWRLATSVPHVGRVIHAAQTPLGRRLLTWAMPCVFLAVWMTPVWRERQARAHDPTVLPRVRRYGTR